jgi:hypothetical protein
MHRLEKVTTCSVSPEVMYNLAGGCVVLPIESRSVHEDGRPKFWIPVGQHNLSGSVFIS